MSEHDPGFLYGIDDLASPLRTAANKIERVCEQLQSHGDALELALARPRTETPGKAAGEGQAEAAFARQLYKYRRRREAVFGSDLFGEPAWDMLLDLFVAGEEQRRISVSSACIASAGSASAGLRTLRLLVDQGHVVREADPSDKRRTWVALSPGTVASMRELLRGLQISPSG